MKRKEELSPEEILEKIRDAGFSNENEVRRTADGDEIEDFNTRMDKLLSISKIDGRGRRMLFFVMYDIESNKVRNLVAKYLIRMGCTRIQKSIFLADLEPDSVSKIKSDLADVQSAYENNDSILIVPVSTDELRAMKIIGQNIDVDLIVRNKNTLFF